MHLQRVVSPIPWVQVHTSGNINGSTRGCFKFIHVHAYGINEKGSWLNRTRDGNYGEERWWPQAGWKGRREEGLMVRVGMLYGIIAEIAEVAHGSYEFVGWGGLLLVLVLAADRTERCSG
jgi:hypothetical protein